MGSNNRELSSRQTTTPLPNPPPTVGKGEERPRRGDGKSEVTSGRRECPASRASIKARARTCAHFLATSARNSAARFARSASRWGHEQRADRSQSEAARAGRARPGRCRRAARPRSCPRSCRPARSRSCSCPRSCRKPPPASAFAGRHPAELASPDVPAGRYAGGGRRHGEAAIQESLESHRDPAARRRGLDGLGGRRAVRFRGRIAECRSGRAGAPDRLEQRS